MWISHPGCVNIVKSSWNTPFIGCPMFVLNQKLKHLKLALKIWNKTTFGNIHDRVKIATEKVQNIQRELDSIGVTDDLLNQEKLAQIDLEKALD